MNIAVNTQKITIFADFYYGNTSIIQSIVCKTKKENLLHVLLLFAMQIIFLGFLDPIWFGVSPSIQPTKKRLKEKQNWFCCCAIYFDGSWAPNGDHIINSMRFTCRLIYTDKFLNFAKCNKLHFVQRFESSCIIFNVVSPFLFICLLALFLFFVNWCILRCVLAFWR